ncbi:MAG: type II toxin-antitoxin system HicB family antitoxin [Acidobacteria bacterium]|nr:type II toxin-antitoxin system HicB family antitoxin [Acidobacteriota bacterium]
MDFLIVLEPCADGYGVYVPELPGCTSGGDTLALAYNNAEEAILGHLNVMVEDGEDLPRPSKNPEAPHDLNSGDLVAMVRVDLSKLELFNKTTPITVTIPLRTKALLDSAAKRTGLSRSAFLARAAMKLIEETK